MDCTVIEESLVPFHFGEVSPATRARYEAHLGDCPACLRSFWDLKRQLEASAHATEVPPPVVRARVRATLFGDDIPAPRPTPPRRVPPLRPARWVPASLTAAAVGGLLLVWQAGKPRGDERYVPTAHRARAVDTARPEAASLNFL